jgi:hypothetical protein
VWDGERLFQAGRFVTEMQYQHLVFEEFARGSGPERRPVRVLELADHQPGHRRGVRQRGVPLRPLDAHRHRRAPRPHLAASDIGLIQAFLNPVEFTKNGTLTEDQAIGSIIRGMSRQVGNEIDEFIVEALRNNLVGLPLDLATLNMARARETGAPTFNEARAAFYEQTGDSQFAPYTSWADLAPHLKNPASIVNFVAAYGDHPSITGQVEDSVTARQDRGRKARCRDDARDRRRRRTGGPDGFPARHRRLRRGCRRQAGQRRRDHRRQRHRLLDRRPGRSQAGVRRHAWPDLQLRVRKPDGEPAERRPDLLPQPHAGPQHDQ